MAWPSLASTNGCNRSGTATRAVIAGNSVITAETRRRRVVAQAETNGSARIVGGQAGPAAGAVGVRVVDRVPVRAQDHGSGDRRGAHSCRHRRRRPGAKRVRSEPATRHDDGDHDEERRLAEPERSLAPRVPSFPRRVHAHMIRPGSKCALSERRSWLPPRANRYGGVARPQPERPGSATPVSGGEDDLSAKSAGGKLAVRLARVGEGPHLCDPGTE